MQNRGTVPRRQAIYYGYGFKADVAGGKSIHIADSFQLAGVSHVRTIL